MDSSIQDALGSQEMRPIRVAQGTPKGLTKPTEDTA